ncbi:MAG: hypothetical protein ACK5QY_12000 [Pseudanabaena sp.]|jgi:hypothetical protein
MTTNKPRKKNFSSFTPIEAMKQLNLNDLIEWQVEIIPKEPSLFFKQRLERLECFDLQSVEESKKLLIDAVCEEAIQEFKLLRIWKGASLEGDRASGYVDYLIAERKRYLEAPMLCIIEAKKDDFEQGLAQCLVEMQACQWINHKLGREIDVLGIVTNGTTWNFYKLVRSGQVYETAAHALGDLEVVLGWLNYIFQNCEHNLVNKE